MGELQILGVEIHALGTMTIERVALDGRGETFAGGAMDTKLVGLDYNWPGNIRELEHTMERAVIIGEIGIPHFSLPSSHSSTPLRPSPQWNATS